MLKNDLIGQTVKSILLSICISLSMICVFAFIVKMTKMSSITVNIVNQFIKIISVFIGCFFSLKGEKGIIKGAISGIGFNVLIYLIFLIFGQNGFDKGFFIDMIFCLLIGVISGIISINTKNSN
ncbi:MAG: TIGR04086 family membrane protein [Clostridia bacterium]|nr:TIGR04086 family membrane protein [Clostridia bacterium]